MMGIGWGQGEASNISLSFMSSSSYTKGSPIVLTFVHNAGFNQFVIVQ